VSAITSAVAPLARPRAAAPAPPPWGGGVHLDRGHRDGAERTWLPVAIPPVHQV